MGEVFKEFRKLALEEICGFGKYFGKYAVFSAVPYALPTTYKILEEDEINNPINKKGKHTFMEYAGAGLGGTLGLAIGPGSFLYAEYEALVKDNYIPALTVLGASIVTNTISKIRETLRKAKLNVHKRKSH